MRSARSRLSLVPTAQFAAVVSASVSGPASTRKRSRSEVVASTTVRQTPEQAIDAPMAGSRSTSGLSMTNRVSSGCFSTDTTVPIAVTMPVNMWLKRGF